MPQEDDNCRVSDMLKFPSSALLLPVLVGSESAVADTIQRDPSNKASPFILLFHNILVYC